MRLFVAIYPAEAALDHLAAAVSELRLGMATVAGNNVRLVARPLWHVTLAFLGELPDDRAPEAAAALHAGVSRWRQVRHPAAARSSPDPRDSGHGQRHGQGPGQSHGQGSGQGPGQGPGQGSGQGPGQDSGQGGRDGDVPIELRLAGGGRFGRRRSTTLWIGLAGELDAFRSLGDAVRRELRRARVPYDHKPLRPHLTFARPGERLPAADVAADLARLREYEGPHWTIDAVHLVRSKLGPKPVHDRIATVPLARAANDSG